ncbi:hypothetical protein AINA4_03830 [Aurantimicrobium sp. INA4]|uniref:hypothetical protein n=1 Tax=Aurantimicrobium sp. INA4 TaxID=2986279 RepID=UPI0024900A96|nr:hypothetical protein [Aurantimicrobium sp. INA4]BDU10462.1 hypothetical protein AINA4_03830 [Aurantimicrobium sp. INA4]
MAASTPETFDPAQEPKSSKAKTAASALKPAVQPSAAVASYPGQTLGIVALVFAFFMPLPALALGIIAWVWSNKAGKNNVLAKVAVFVSGALTIIGIFLLGMWVAFTAAVFSGPFGPAYPAGEVHISGGGGHMMFDGDMMHEFDQLEGEMKHMLPAPGDLPQLEAPQSN